MHVVVMEDYQRAVESLDCFALTGGHDIVVHSKRPETVEERVAQIGTAEAIVLVRERTPIDEPLLARLPALRLICQTGRGTPHIDLEACTRRGIAVCTGSGSPHAPAELTLALILASTRCVVADAVALREGRWQTTFGRELHGRVLGIAGYGAIGALVAGYGRTLGMRVLAWGRSGSLGRALADGHEAEPDLDRLCMRSDVLSLHLKLAPETGGILTARHLALMNPDALLVNTARAGLIAPGALVAALAAGRPGYAAVDVYDDEPALGDPLLHDPRVLATPHLGYVTRETYELYFGEAFAQLNAFAAGQPTGVVNPEVLDARPERAGRGPV
jgi:D-3-phosphoglycerate dehydrogenase / 2-oxoglutarate reductase